MPSCYTSHPPISPVLYSIFCTHTHLQPTVPLCVALVDCLATEPGTIDIGEGEVLEMIDNSRHDWCLVRRTTFREPSEGWVRSSFIRYCSKGDSNSGESAPPLGVDWGRANVRVGVEWQRERVQVKSDCHVTWLF